MKQKTGITVGEETKIKTLDEFWQVDNVQYRNEIYTVGLGKQLLDDGKAKTQAQWAEYSRQAIEENKPYTPNFQLLHATIEAVHDSNSPDKEQIRQFLKEKARERWLITLTRLQYQPQGEDIVIHDFNMPSQFQEQVRFRGKDENLKDAHDNKPYKTLLGVDNIQKIQEIHRWLNETDVFLFRVNSKPQTIDERVAWLYASSLGAYLSCCGFPSFTYASLGVFASASSEARANARK